MSLPIPKPLMSDKPERMHRPSSFPLGAAKRQIENFSKGALRIPDVVILTVKAAGIIAMRQSGVIEWDRFYPEGANIERVVDVKFGKDDWFAGQYQAYLKIAPGKVREIRDRDCSCDTRKPPNGGVKIPVYPPIKNPMPYKSATFRPTNLALAPTKGIPSMLGGLGKMVAPPSPKVIFYRKFVPLQEYRGMMIPITASVGIVGAFICGTVVFAGAAAGVGITAGAIGASEAVSGGLLITGFATLSHAN